MKPLVTYLKLIFKAELFRNISVLASGTALAQVIPILLQPFLRRYYSAENYGAFSVYLSIIGILMVASTLKYDQAIILPKKEKEANNVFILSLIINLLINSTLLVFVILLKENLASFLNLNQGYSFYLYFIPIGNFFYSFYQSINNILIREKKFLAISSNKLIRRSTEGITQVAASFTIKSTGLLLGDILGQLANIINGIRLIFKTSFHIKDFSIIKIKYVAKKYKEFPLVNLIPSILSAASYFLPVVLINKFYSQEYAGYFDLAKLVLSVPMALIAASIANVLLQRVSEKSKRKQSVKKEIYQIGRILIILAILEIAIISIWGESLFSFLFGNQNKKAGLIAEIMVWSFGINFIISSLSSIFVALNKIKLWSIWQIVYFLCITSLFLFRELEFEKFLKYLVGIELFCYTLYIIVAQIILSKYEKEIR